MTFMSESGMTDFVIPVEDPGSILLHSPLQTAVGRYGFRIESGMTLMSESGMTDFVIPGEDPGSILLHCPLQTAVG
jgi:hypothetical protein